MSSIFDLYLKNNIMTSCEAYFNDYLKEEGILGEALKDREREIIVEQVEIIINMLEQIYKEHDDEFYAYSEIIDKLIGFCIVAKMNEVRLCRLLNDAIDIKDN